MESLTTQTSSDADTGPAFRSPYPSQQEKEQPWKKFYPAFRPASAAAGKMVVTVPYANHDNGTNGLGGY